MEGGSRVALMASDERELEGTLEGVKKGRWGTRRAGWGSFTSGCTHGMADGASEMRTLRIRRTLRKGGQQCKNFEDVLCGGSLTANLHFKLYAPLPRHSRTERSDDVIVSAISANGLLFCSAAAKWLSSSLSFGTALQPKRTEFE